jgi:hypothetical protein
VPGANGDRPEPKPSAMACAGWLNMKRAEGTLRLPLEALRGAGASEAGL